MTPARRTVRGGRRLHSATGQVLMELLEDVAVPGERFAVCENRGSGISAMVAALRQAGMTPPVFEDREEALGIGGRPFDGGSGSCGPKTSWS